MSKDWKRADEVEWETFYQAVEGRELRALFVDAIPLLPAGDHGHELVAVDLGCGDGTETLELLRQGWTVLAVDGSADGIARLRKAAASVDDSRLTTRVAAFRDASLPPADLVYAGLSLPFCAPGDFGEVWLAILSALRPGGLFVGHLFGPNDTWADTPDMTFHSRADVERLLAGLEVEQLHEQDEDGEAVGGPKHWHVFHLIARQP